jgi:hypothetical protein
MAVSGYGSHGGKAVPKLPDLPDCAEDDDVGRHDGGRYYIELTRLACSVAKSLSMRVVPHDEPVDKTSLVFKRRRVTLRLHFPVAYMGMLAPSRPKIATHKAARTWTTVTCLHAEGGSAMTFTLFIDHVATGDYLPFTVASTAPDVKVNGELWLTIITIDGPPSHVGDIKINVSGMVNGEAYFWHSAARLGTRRPAQKK